jgi:hypothetical protein
MAPRPQRDLARWFRALLDLQALDALDLAQRCGVSAQTAVGWVAGERALTAREQGDLARVVGLSRGERRELRRLCRAEGTVIAAIEQAVEG